MNGIMQEFDIATLQKKVRRIEIVSKRLVSERMAGEYHSVFKGQGIEFEEVRPYIPGDEIRSIDWNVTARAGAPHVKRFREEREQTVFFVVDLSGSSQFGSRVAFKSELAAEICAVLAMAAIANNDRTGLLLATDRPEMVVPPRKGKRHVLRLVREVLAFQPAGRGTDLAMALDQLRHVLNRRAIVFLISDFLAEGYERPLAVVGRRHDVIAIHIEDALERELPKAGLIEIVDGETGWPSVVDTGDNWFRRQFADRSQRRRAALRTLCGRHEIDLIELLTDRPYESALFTFFRQRAKRLARR